ncbi:MAG: glutathione S-transferase N-terminal domain-containing protein [Pseudomonadota bacterium]
MILYGATPSPFVAKAAMAALHGGVAITIKPVNVGAGDPELDALNPLSKIPCLKLDDGRAIYDSRAITRFLDRESGGKLYPTDHDTATVVETMEALCDGICDCGLSYVYENRMRPPEKVSQDWLDRQLGKILRGLDALNANPPAMGAAMKMDAIACAATLGYMDLRFEGMWRDGRDGLVQWLADFEANHADLAALKPSA